MAAIFNLSIQAYNINELKELLNLQDPFTLEDIVNNENMLREKLLMDEAVSQEKKGEIIKFLEIVKKKLIEDTKKRLFKYAKMDYLSGGDHAVMHRQSGVSSQINPIPRDEAATAGTSKHTIHRLLCMDSRFRNNYYTTLSTDYQVTLPTVVKNVISMELSALEFPSTYYQISKSLGNNYFWFGWNKDAELKWYYISVPDGNYRRQDIQDAINEQIVVAISALPPLLLSPLPVCKIDEHSVKTVFSMCQKDLSGESPIPPKTQFYLLFNRTSGKYKGGATPPFQTGETEPPPTDLDGTNGIISNLGWILGYRLGEYKGSWAYVSEGCYDAWGTKYIYVVVNDFNKNVNNFVVTAYNESIGKSNVLARISTDSATSSDFSSGLSLTNDTLGQNDAIKKRSYFGPVDISRLQLQILDEFGRVLDLNNMDYSMALNLVCLYD
jgi:hypothetical protein